MERGMGNRGGGRKRLPSRMSWAPSSHALGPGPETSGHLHPEVRPPGDLVPGEIRTSSCTPMAWLPTTGLTAHWALL